jgi:hypothetical protein
MVSKRALGCYEPIARNLLESGHFAINCSGTGIEANSTGSEKYTLGQILDTAISSTNHDGVRMKPISMEGANNVRGSETRFTCNASDLMSENRHQLTTRVYSSLSLDMNKTESSNLCLETKKILNLVEESTSSALIERGWTLFSDKPVDGDKNVPLPEEGKAAFSAGDGPKSSPSSPQKDPLKPTEEQLLAVNEELTIEIRRFFNHGHNFNMYTNDILFEDNVRGVRTKGLTAYMQSLFKAKIMGHIKYTRVSVKILKTTQHPEDGTVRVRWRIEGVPGMLSFVLNPFRMPSTVMKQTEWIDGFSIFYVNGNAKIFKHVCNKMIPDQESVVKKPLGVALGV